jgi:GntR family transcriptional regulator / MocR family aminotransferase
MSGSEFLQLARADVGRGRLTGWLVDAIRAAIADGRLPVGSRLPATRVLATELGVSRGVVVAAYQRLADEGRISAQGSRGTVVTTAPPAPVARPAPAREPPAYLNLSPGLPDLSAFPRAAWLRTERQVLNRATAAELGYGDPRGAEPLRRELTGWLGRTRGIRADPADVVVVAGVAQALALVVQVLRARGVHAVGVEDPGSRGTRDQLARWGLEPRPVPVDERGLDVDRLGRGGLDAVLVTPAHQFPTGVVLAPERRRALLDWAVAGGLVIEDDYDAEHRYDRPPVGALQGLAPDRVAYTGSTSKTLAPALRLGWLIPPPALREEIAAAKLAADLASPTLPQLVLAALLACGELERHLRVTRSRQRARRNAMLEALGEHLPDARVHGVAAGLHLLITLPEGVDDAALADRARTAGILVQPLSAHRQGHGPPGLVLGYAAHPPDRIRQAVRRLAQILA